MKKMKWLGATGAVLAIGAAGFLAVPSSANGATVTITAGSGSSISCTLNGGSAALSPTLQDDWTPPANDTTTSVQTFKDAIASIPATTFSSPGPTTTTVKAAGTCTPTSSVTDGTHTTNVVSIKVAGLSVGTSTDNATCGGLATAALSGETFALTITYTGTTGGPKIAPTTIAAGHLAALASHGVGFEVTASGSDLAGSFAGGSSDGKTYIDQTSLTAFTDAVLGAKPNFGNNGVTGSVCDPTLGIKATPASGLASDAVAIKMKKPKGLKKISFINSGGQTPAPDVATDSTLDMSA